MKDFWCNWKTTAAGSLTVLTGIAGLLGYSATGTPMSAEAAVGLIVTGVGLIFAKDHNVTGGTVKQ